MSYFPDGKIFPYQQWKEIQELARRIVKNGISPDFDIQAMLDRYRRGEKKLDINWEVTNIILQKSKPRNNDEAQLNFDFFYEYKS